MSNLLFFYIPAHVGINTILLHLQQEVFDLFVPQMLDVILRARGGFLTWIFFLTSTSIKKNKISLKNNSTLD
ncbi:hypothetical protein VCHA53O466_140166 [Vibrio chagasii]|nr:hypothetical protein VCHA53O466_140166 [Vibrio chagasii]